MKKLGLLFILILSTTIAFPQEVGDYGSAGDGNWGTGATWVVCATAGTWTGATVASSQPNETKNVWIRSGDTVTVDGSGKKCLNITVENGASLVGDAALLPNSSIRYIRIYGPIAQFDGTVGGPAPGTTVAFEMYGSFTMQGSGTINPARIRTGTGISDVTLTIDCNMTMMYTGGSGTGGAAIYTGNSANDNITITLNQGRTLTFVDYAYLGTSSSTSSDGIANTIFNINGTLVQQGVSATTTLNVAAGKTCELNIGANGSMSVSKNFNASGGAGTVTITNNGTLTLGTGGNGTIDFTDPTVFVGGTGATTISSGAKLLIGAPTGLEPVAGPIRTTTRNFNANCNYDYVGTAAQVTGSELPSTIYKLTIHDTAGVTLSAAVTLTDTGSISAGAFLVETNSNYVSGVMKTTQLVGKEGSTLGGIGIELNAGGADSLGNVTVIRTSGTAPSSSLFTAINRSWDIISDNPPAAGRDVTFNWASGDDGSADLTKAIVFKSTDAGSNWSEASDVNGIDVSGVHQITAPGVTSFSLWTVGEAIIVVPALSGDYYIPQGSNPQGFATLNDAVTSLNTNGASGTINFLLDADTLRENSFTFNANLSADNNVVVKPAPGRDVVLIVTPGVSKGNGIQMIGFDKGYVTIDGSNDGSDSRNLTITTDLTDTRVPIGLNTANADTVTIKNLIIKNLDNVVTNFRYGIVTNDIGGIEGLTIENCQIGTSDRPVWRYGVAIWGDASNGVDATVINNEINSEGRGIATLYYGSCVFNNNFINMLPGAGTGSYTYNEGIYLSWGNYAEVHNNVINLLEKTTIPNAISKGISSASHPEGAVQSIVNNMINVGAPDEAGTVRGIDFISANPHRSFKIYHNTIVVNEMTSTLVSYGITHTGTGAVDIDLKNNIIINNHSGNTGSSAIGLVPVTSVLVSDYNDLLSNQNLVNYQGTLYTDLAAWQATTQDSNSVSKSVNFVSATDLHLTGASDGDFDLAGTPLAGITTDIDGDTRSTSYPYMGADEASIKLILGVTIAEAREDLNVDGIPDRLGETLLIHGVVISPNYQTSNHSYYIWDGTAGITEILFGTTLPALSLGDSVEMVGKIGIFNGLTQISLAASTDLTVIGSGSVLPTPVELTLAQYKANPETYEGTLLKFSSLTKLATPAWPASGSATLKFSDGVDTVDFRIDSDTDIDGSTEPSWPADIVGIGSQFSSGATSYFDGYQILPRYATDFTSVGTSVENENTTVTQFELAQNYPNPFNPTTKINYSVPFDSKVTISVYAITGELVAELINDYKSMGTYSVNFNGSNLASGMYIYRMVAGSFVQTNKMMLLK